MEIKVIKDGTTEEMVYNGLELLEKIASKIIDKSNSAVSLKTDKENNNTVTLETLQQDNELLLTFVGTYSTIAPSFKDMVTEYQKIKDSETFRNKIIDREIKGLTGYIEMLDVGKITEKPTDLQILKMQIKSTLEITVKVLKKLKDTYSKDENTLRIEM
ncbi:hypothetical protein [uncultured Gemella sp.]|uniref:hypothetical protein n=1 Tax=uncultured Gemella sp. TaxID=254352 RepID=UPI0028D0A195|nr:hypothetical protein [uncultured Gemella sp.]